MPAINIYAMHGILHAILPGYDIYHLLKIIVPLFCY